MNKLQEQMMLGGAPMSFSTYTPPQIDEETPAPKEYNYSLCESIDYQQALLKNETPVAAQP